MRSSNWRSFSTNASPAALPCGFSLALAAGVAAFLAFGLRPSAARFTVTRSGASATTGFGATRLGAAAFGATFFRTTDLGAADFAAAFGAALGRAGLPPTGRLEDLLLGAGLAGFLGVAMTCLPSDRS